MRLLAAVLATTAVALAAAGPADGAGAKLKQVRACDQVTVKSYGLTHTAFRIKVYRNWPGETVSSCGVIRVAIRRMLENWHSGKCLDGFLTGAGCRVSVPRSGRWACEPNNDAVTEALCSRGATLAVFRLRG